MALSANSVFQVQTDGSDTLNGGIFDPSQTAGMFADGAATSATTTAPVFTSASYNFVAGDVGAWLFIASGTNWTAGYYQIASVAANAATLAATSGVGVLIGQTGLTTADGCATVASPTSATWTIDYSQQAAAQFAYTDLASVGAGLLVSSVALPFAKQQVGNALVITGGTNFTVGRYVIASVAAGVATVVGAANITTGAGVTGTGGLGGAYVSPAMPCGIMVNGSRLFIKAATYTISSTTANIAGGRMSITARSVVCGYSTARTLVNTNTKPILQASVGTFMIYTNSVSQTVVYNLTFDGNGQAAVGPMSAGIALRCHFLKITAVGTQQVSLFCTATECSVSPFYATGMAAFCEAYANTATPFNGGDCIHCISRGNTGATTDGFAVAVQYLLSGCVSYGNGRSGYLCTSSGSVINSIAEANTGYGYSWATSTSMMQASINNAAYNNTAGTETGGPPRPNIGFITITDGSPFTNAAAGDFSLNTTALRGALLRATGFPALFPSGLTATSFDIGAAQHADPAGGGGTVGRSTIIQNIGTY